MSISDNPVWMEALNRAPGLPELRPIRTARWLMIILSGAVFCLIAWAGFTPVNVVTNSYGQVVPGGHVQAIQHLEGGIVQDVLVKEGQAVKAGQVLLVMSPTGVASDRNQLVQQQRALLIERERTQAYIEGRAPDFTRFAEADRDVLAENQRAYASMLEARAREAEIIRAQIAQRKDALRTLQVRYGALSENMSIAAENLSIKKDLFEKGYYSRLNYLDKREQVASIEGDRAATAQEIQRTKSEIAEFESRLSSFDAGDRETSYERLTQLNNEIAKNDEALAKYTDRLARLEVRAPVAGVVKGIEITTVGGIAAPGQKLMEVVPDDAELLVEARVRPSDVGQLHDGLPVRVKVHAFDYTRFGGIEGQLQGLSATTFADENHQSYFRATVALKQNFVGTDSAKNRLIPGMTVDAEIITDRRSLLSYLLKPVQTMADTAFTER